MLSAKSKICLMDEKNSYIYSLILLKSVYELQQIIFLIASGTLIPLHP